MQVGPNTAQAVLRELPDALRPGWLQSAWNGSFGSRALAATVRDIDVVVRLDDAGIAGTAAVRGTISGRAEGLLGRLRSLGREQLRVGSFRQTMHLHEDGLLEARHRWLRLARGWRGDGFSGGFTDQAEHAYALAGVDEVRLRAGLSVGGYAWARRGFELAVDGANEAEHTLARGREVARIVDRASRPIFLEGPIPRLGRLTAADRVLLEPRLVRGAQLPPDALTSVGELAAMPGIGRRALLGSTWQAVGDPKKVAPWWRGGEGPIGAATRIRAALPAAVDPARLSAALEARLATGGVAATVDAERGARAVLRANTDGLHDVRAIVPLRTADGASLLVDVVWDGARLRAGHAVPRAQAALRDVLDGALRELGVEDVRRLSGRARRDLEQQLRLTR